MIAIVSIFKALIKTYKFKIETVTQLLEFHARSDHQTDDRFVRETRVTVLQFLS